MGRTVQNLLRTMLVAFSPLDDRQLVNTLFFFLLSKFNASSVISLLLRYSSRDRDKISLLIWALFVVLFMRHSRAGCALYLDCRCWNVIGSKFSNKFSKWLHFPVISRDDQSFSTDCQMTLFQSRVLNRFHGYSLREYRSIVGQIRCERRIGKISKELSCSRIDCVRNVFWMKLNYLGKNEGNKKSGIEKPNAIQGQKQTHGISSASRTLVDSPPGSWQYVR